MRNDSQTRFHRFFALTALFCACAWGTLVLCSFGATRAATNPIQAENLLAGSAGWVLSNPSNKGEIQGYAGQDSLNLGERLCLYVSTTAPSYDLEIYRMGYYGGKGGRLKLAHAGIPGVNQGSYVQSEPYPSDCNSQGVCAHSIVSYLVDGVETHMVDANWRKSLSIDIPTTWISGYYLAKLTESRTHTQWHVPFVVRNDAGRPDLLFKAPFSTDQAYNEWGGMSYYVSHRPSPSGLKDRATYVSYNRPFLRANGTQNFFYWEYPMLRFLEEKGYYVGYTTNNAIATAKTSLLTCRGLVTPGHDEYVSQAERAAIERAYKAGVNIAYFGGNNIYWQTRHASDAHGAAARILVCYKVSVNLIPGWIHYTDPVKVLGPLGVPLTTDLWGSQAVHYPENQLLKTNSDGTIKPRVLFDLVVKNSSSWVYTGLGLHDGDRILNAVGVEADETSAFRLGRLATGETATVLSASPFVADDGTWSIANSMLVENSNSGAIVFNGGSIAWPAALTDFESEMHTGAITLNSGYPYIPENPALRQITANVLDRMVRPKV